MKLCCIFRKIEPAQKSRVEDASIRVKYSSKESADIEYNGKIARFSGNIVYEGFRACASSMRWLVPKQEESVSREERVNWINRINNCYKTNKKQIYFVDVNGNELIKYNEDVYIKITHSAKGSADVKYNGKTARILGNEIRNGIKADINSMRWVSPKRIQHMPVFQAERDHWTNVINEYYANVREPEFRVYF